jgi:hypothetical protein
MHRTRADELSRRQFMVDTAFKCLGVTVAPLMGATVAGAAAPGAAGGGGGKARGVIFLNMNGGMSHIDTFDLKQRKPEVQGPVKAISTSVAGLQISEYLPLLASQAHHLCIINSMESNQGAHEQGQYFIHRSYPPRGTIVHPSLGAWVMRLAGRRNSTIPGFVAIGGGEDSISPGFMGAKFAGVSLPSPKEGLRDIEKPGYVTHEEFDRRLALADELNAGFHSKFSQRAVREHRGIYEDAVRMMRSADLEAFDITKEDDGLREKYGYDNFGQGCLLARRLVEHGVRFVEVGLGGWDTHYDNFRSVEARCKVLDRGMAALLNDLHGRGMLEETLVVLATEFGRTPEIVAEHNNGRDHHPRAFSCVLAGGGVAGGQIYGKTDASGNRVAENPVSVPSFNATIAHAMGLPLETVIMSPSGRPFTVADKAPPVTKIFA